MIIIQRFRTRKMLFVRYTKTSKLNYKRMNNFKEANFIREKWLITIYFYVLF